MYLLDAFSGSVWGDIVIDAKDSWLYLVAKMQDRGQPSEEYRLNLYDVLNIDSRSSAEEGKWHIPVEWFGDGLVYMY